MTTPETATLLTAVISAVTLIGTCWNAFQHNKVKLLIAELQLNVRREFNGRYVQVTSFDDAKERIKRLEEAHDAEQHC